MYTYLTHQIPPLDNSTEICSSALISITFARKPLSMRKKKEKEKKGGFHTIFPSVSSNLSHLAERKHLPTAAYRNCNRIKYRIGENMYTWNCILDLQSQKRTHYLRPWAPFPNLITSALSPLQPHGDIFVGVL